tara:strand:- start:27 stop:536 length:510 start_codon:yes stop_codon:yes gene_type:complete
MVRKEELDYIKKMYEQPDEYLDYKMFSEFVDTNNLGFIPDESYWDEIAYLSRPTKEKSQFDGRVEGVTVCQCVWEMTGKNTHGALVYYLREVIKAGGIMPVNVNIKDGKVIYLDGSHRVLAHIQLGIQSIPVYLNREKHHWTTCWRPGMIMEDGTLNMKYDFSKEGIIK